MDPERPELPPGLRERVLREMNDDLQQHRGIVVIAYGAMAACGAVVGALLCALLHH